MKRLHPVGPLVAMLTMCAACARADADQGRITRAWPVMGTTLQVTVWDTDTGRAQAAIDAARATVFRVDTLMSVYKPQSDLSVANRRAGTDTFTVVDPRTAQVLTRALQLARESDGALDVTVGPLVDVWGFYRHHGTVPGPAARDSAAALVGWRKVEFDPATRRVRLPVRGMRLDFGGIAKGYALDAGVAALRAAGVRRGMVDLGGNFRVFGASNRPDGWTVGLKDPRDPGEVLATVRIDSGAVGTSGDYEQFFVYRGVRYTHIFDPRTGSPARGVVAVSVIAPDGMDSDALSKPLFVMGPEEGCRYAARHPGVEALWVRDPGSTNLLPSHVVMTDGLAGRAELLIRGNGRARFCHELAR